MDNQILKIYIKSEISRIQHSINMGNILPVAGLAQIDVLEKLEDVFQLDKETIKVTYHNNF
jgi:hypothetical protein